MFYAVDLDHVPEFYACEKKSTDRDEIESFIKERIEKYHDFDDTWKIMTTEELRELVTEGVEVDNFYELEVDPNETFEFKIKVDTDDGDEITVEVPDKITEKLIKDSFIGESGYKFASDAKYVLQTGDPKSYLKFSVAASMLYGYCLNAVLPPCFPEGVDENSFTDESFRFLELARKNKNYHINDIINVGAFLNELSMEGSCD